MKETIKEEKIIESSNENAKGKEEKTIESSDDNMKPKTVHDIFRDSEGKKLDLSTLNVYEVFKKIEEFKKMNGCNAENQDIVAVIGNTKCGKSALLNLILGNKLISIAQEAENPFNPKFGFNPKLYEQIVEAPEIGGDFFSKTTIPEVYAYTSTINNINTIFWDCPGFGDNRGPQQEIVNAYSVNRLFTTAQKVAVLNLIDYESLSVDNVEGFKRYVGHLKDLFGEGIKDMHQSIVVTKLPLVFDHNKLKGGVNHLLTKFFPEDNHLTSFFIENAEYAYVTRPEEANEIWGSEKVVGIIELLSKALYEDYQKVGISLNADTKLYLHTNGHEISQVLIQSYLRCFKGQDLLAQFYKQVFTKVLCDTDVQQLQTAMSESISSTYKDYKSSVLDKYNNFEQEIDNFVKKVCKELDVMTTVTQAKEMVDKYCLYDLSYCSTKHLLQYLKDHGFNKKFHTDTFNTFENNIDHIKFSETATKINLILDVQRQLNKAQVQSAETQIKAIEERAKDKYNEAVANINIENAKAVKLYHEKLVQLGFIKIAAKMVVNKGIDVVNFVDPLNWVWNIKIPKFNLSEVNIKPSLKEMEKKVDDFKSTPDMSFNTYYEQNQAELLKDAFGTLPELPVLGDNNIN